MKTIIKFEIAIYKEYNGEFVTTSISDIMKDMIGSDFLTGMSNLFYYWYIRTSNMILRYESVLALMAIQNGADAG